MTLPLQHACLGDTYRVVSVEGIPESTQRIRELGVVVGARCRVVRKSPFGGPIQVALEYRHVGIRLTDVHVLVELFEVPNLK